jgi:predicted metal-dependent TIM-barrel fold hydrolase
MIQVLQNNNDAEDDVQKKLLCFTKLYNMFAVLHTPKS